MRLGIVKGREAQARLTIHGMRGRLLRVEAIVDTGYTGWLTLPASAIAALGLRWLTVGRGILADGSISVFDVYRAKIAWDDRVRPVLVKNSKQLR